MRRSGRGGEQKDPAPRSALYQTGPYGPEPPEAAFQQQVLTLARMQGWECYFTWSSINSPAGFPDLVMVRGNRIVFAELKSASGELTVHQRRWVWILAAAGMEVKLWKPATWKQIEECLLRRPAARQRPPGISGGQ